MGEERQNGGLVGGAPLLYSAGWRSTMVRLRPGGNTVTGAGGAWTDGYVRRAGVVPGPGMG